MFSLPYILNKKLSWCLVQQVNSNELLFSKIIPEHNDTFIPILHKFQKSIIKYVGLVLLQPLTKSRSPLLIVKLATCKGPNKSFPPLLLPLNLSRFKSVPICWANWCAHHGCLTIFVFHTISVSDLIDCGKNSTVGLCHINSVYVRRKH